MEKLNSGALVTTGRRTPEEEPQESVTNTAALVSVVVQTPN